MYLLIQTERNTHFSVAVGDREGIIKFKTVRKPYRQSELLLKQIDKFVGAKKIEGIAVVTGPGDFSALRIGISTANALSYAWGVPVVGLKLDKPHESGIETEQLDFLYHWGLKLLKKNRKKKTLVFPEYGQVPNITMKK